MTEKGRYQIQVQGWISERWASWFEDVTMIFERDPDGTLHTTMTAVVADQAALRGILARIWDLNLTLLSVNRCDTKGAETNEG